MSITGISLACFYENVFFYQLSLKVTNWSDLIDTIYSQVGCVFFFFFRNYFLMKISFFQMLAFKIRNYWTETLIQFNFCNKKIHLFLLFGVHGTFFKSKIVLFFVEILSTKNILCQNPVDIFHFQDLTSRQNNTCFMSSI